MKSAKGKYLILVIALAVFLSLALISFLYYRVKQKEAIKLKRAELTTTRDKTSAELVDYFQKLQGDLFSFLSSETTRKFLELLKTNFQKGIHSKEYQEVKNAFLDYLASQGKNISSQHFVFVSTTGEIVFTSNGKETGFNIFHDSLKNNELSLSLIRCYLTRTHDLSKFEFNTESREEEGYFSLSLENGGDFLGTVAFGINIKPIYDSVLSPDLIYKDEEILLLQQRKNEIALISPTRSRQVQAFQVIASYHPFDMTPIDLAISGQMGSGEGVVMENNVVAAWNYIPYLNWGIVVVSELNVLLSSITYLIKLTWFFLLCAAALFIVLIFLKWGKRFREVLYSPRTLPKILVAAIVIALIGVGHQAYLLYTSKQKAIASAQSTMRMRTEQISKQISQEPKDVVFTTNWLSKDLEIGRLKKEDLPIRLRRDFRENLALQKTIVAFKPPPLDSFMAVRKGDKVEVLPLEFDYTNPSQFSNVQENWYEEALSEKKRWLSVFQDQETRHPIAIYIAPFKGEKEGVVASYLDLFNFQKTIEETAAGSFVHTFLISEHGKVVDSVTKESLAASSFFEASAKKTGEFLKFKDNKGETFYLFVEPISHTPWFVAVLISEKNITIDVSMLRKLIFGLITAVLVLCIAILATLVFFYTRKGRKLFSFTIIYVMCLGIGIFCLWITVRATSNIPPVKGLLIQDKNGLDNFVNKIKKEASNKFLEPPVFIPTGIWISFLDFSHMEEKVAFSGLAWQKYPLHTSLKHKLVLPQATELQMEEIFSDVSDKYSTLNWYIKGVLDQIKDTSPFPFDNFLIKIYLENIDNNPNVYLIPDLVSYLQYTPTEKPGISSSISIPGYELSQTFFSLENDPFLTNLGRDKNDKEVVRHALCFNIYLIRQFLIPFIPFIIPVIVILVGIYTVFLMTKKEKGFNFVTNISVYTGAFLGLAILQLSLRSRYAGESILYAETFFFLGYFIICLLYTHAILTKLSLDTNSSMKIEPFLQYLYWPFQLTVWYLIALVYFYN